MKRALAVAAALLAPSSARADANAEAQALFALGISDMRSGNLDAACRELAASLAKADDSGTKGALATCYTKQGKLASAWSMWNILASTATDPSDRTDAAKAATDLAPRLPRFQIKLLGAAPAGLVVTINGASADPTLGVALPVDPGPVVAAAHAPDHDDWTQTYEATEGKLVTIEVPALPARPVAVRGPDPRPIVLREDTSASRHSRHVIGAAVGIVGIAAAGVGAVFGARASSKWSTVKTECGGDLNSCQMLAQAQADTHDARSAALASTILFGVGGAAIVTGAILYLSAPADRERAATALRVTPAVGGASYGLVLTGGW